MKRKHKKNFFFNCHHLIQRICGLGQLLPLDATRCSFLRATFLDGWGEPFEKYSNYFLYLFSVYLVTFPLGQLC